ncbi:MAG: hypothetical protein ABRQ30_07390 [Smithellaceae bacterium]|jgi:uncharacterized protein with von Willebrand factor type A (vWA) domain
MFVNFFYKLRDKGIPISPKSFLILQKALSMGLIRSVEDFYIGARTVLIKSERYFDIYDTVFAQEFRGVVEVDPTEEEINEVARALLDEWLKDPEEVANALGVPEAALKKMTIEELLDYFRERLREQTEAHHGGSKWIGTKGFSPVGHSGFHPGGMRIGGTSHNKSAVKVALEHRYRDYSQDGPITSSQIGEAMKRLKHLQPSGPLDVVNIDDTIRQTMKNAGEIEIIFDRRLADRLKVKLMIDNGGWSMEPFVELIQVLFYYATAQFKELEIYYFHNTIYNDVWRDPQRRTHPHAVMDFVRSDPETRLIIVGDASMAPSELMNRNGAIYFNQNNEHPSIEYLKLLAKTFRHTVWLNPLTQNTWQYDWTIQNIRTIFPMYELTLDGLEKAVQHLMSRN